MKTNYFFSIVLGLLLAGSISCHAQKVGQYVDLSPTAKVYKSPSTNGTAIGFESEEALQLMNEQKPLYPFAQKVLAVKGNWLQIPGGWVQKSDVNVDGGTITESMMTKDYNGLRIWMFDKSQRLAVVTNYKLVYSAKFEGNTLVYNRVIRLYSAEYKADLNDISFSFEDERNGLKWYNIRYGERLMTQVESYFSGYLEYEPALDQEKMTPGDWRAFYDHINSVGTPIQTAISAKTLQFIQSGGQLNFPEKKRDGFPELSKISTDDNSSNKESENVNGMRHLPPALEPKAPPPPVQEERIYDVVEQFPSFPGGEVALQSYLDKNLKIPRAAKKKENQRPVVVTFVLEKDGYISDVAIKEGVHPSMDKEALRVVREMPKWYPYKRNGRAERSTLKLEISFQRKKR